MPPTFNVSQIQILLNILELIVNSLRPCTIRYAAALFQISDFHSRDIKFSLEACKRPPHSRPQPPPLRRQCSRIGQYAHQEILLQSVSKEAERFGNRHPP